MNPIPRLANQVPEPHHEGIELKIHTLDIIGDAVEVKLQSVITCPECGATAEEEMPTDACIFFYECKGCRALLRPLPGDCCVFCSFGSVKCPPIQLKKGCCA